MRMRLSAFKFDLPTSHIALYPAENRDDSRLMVLHRDSGEIEHKTFSDITDYFEERDMLVMNNTKVFPSRLRGKKEKTGADIEIFLLRELNKDVKLWDVLVDPARKIRVGNKLFFGEGELVAEVIDNTTSRGRTIRFLNDSTEEEFYDLIEHLGETPLPKEIDRQIEAEDRERFQTVYAENLGAVTAPTAGLHFTKRLMKRLELKGIDMKTITLHVSLGTFKSVDVEDLTKHKMSSENYWVNEETAQRVNQALQEKTKICAVGTTVMKTLESSVSASGLLKANSGWTDKFIFPPYDFKICHALVTNFHLPKSTLLMTASAFGGYDLVMKAYKIAMKERYNFFTYGDAMLII